MLFLNQVKNNLNKYSLHFMELISFKYAALFSKTSILGWQNFAG